MIFFDDKTNFDEQGMNNRIIKERLKKHVVDNFSVDKMMRDMKELWENRLGGKVVGESETKKD